MKHAACIKNYCYGVGERKGEFFMHIRYQKLFLVCFFKLDIVHMMLPLHPLKLRKVDPLSLSPKNPVLLVAFQK